MESLPVIRASQTTRTGRRGGNGGTVAAVVFSVAVVLFSAGVLWWLLVGSDQYYAKQAAAAYVERSFPVRGEVVSHSVVVSGGQAVDTCRARFVAPIVGEVESELRIRLRRNGSRWEVVSHTGEILKR